LCGCVLCGAGLDVHVYFLLFAGSALPALATVQVRHEGGGMISCATISFGFTVGSWAKRSPPPPTRRMLRNTRRDFSDTRRKTRPLIYHISDKQGRNPVYGNGGVHKQRQA
jgi:hypothetical protein